MAKFALVMLLALAMSWMAVPCGYASDDDAAQDALRDARPVWYDAGADDWRRVQARVPKQRDETEERDPADFELIFDILFVILIVGLVLLIAWVVYVALGLRVTKSADLGEAVASRIRTQVAELPFEADQNLDPFAERDRAHADADWARWIIWHYACQLLWLDQHGHIHLQRSKTNRMYLREVTELPQWKPVLGTTIDWFERVYFGGHPVSAAVVSTLQQAEREVRPDAE